MSGNKDSGRYQFDISESRIDDHDLSPAVREFAIGGFPGVWGYIGWGFESRNVKVQTHDPVKLVPGTADDPSAIGDGSRALRFSASQRWDDTDLECVGLWYSPTGSKTTSTKIRVYPQRNGRKPGTDSEREGDA